MLGTQCEPAYDERRLSYMNGKRRELITVSLLAAICGGAAWSYNYEVFAVVFVLESGVAGIMAIL